ncbi:MAG: hypothetical protein M3R72_08020 [Bacteroidota bacterium]|nr:hypothetical protein [Bacteroidota bacterium]
MGRIIGLFLLLFSLQTFAADTTLHLQLIKTIEGSFSNFYADNLENVYLISSSANGLKKIDSGGDSIATFNNIRYGNIYSLDVTNPLKILVFYKDFSTIVILDRFLASRATIDLRKLDITQVKAVAQSYDGNIWLYDEGEGKIKKIDENNNVLLESSDLRLVFDDSLNPQKIIDNNGQLYLYDTRLGWIIFDYYGAFKKNLPFSHWQNVSVNDNVLWGRNEKQFYYASQNDVDFHTLSGRFVFDDILKTGKERNKLYVLSKVGLTIYNINPSSF